MEHLKQPPELDFSAATDVSLAERWRKWSQTMRLYIDLAMTEKSEKEKCAAFLYILGIEGREIFNTFEIEEANRSKIDIMFEKFDAYCNPKENLTVERYKFDTRNQLPTETFDQYLVDLKVMSKIRSASSETYKKSY
ncbi:Pol polyprotein [Plakobranchus ocellatus]|uniref:Pol polyprotein n=1 Tax=Plakobranchus ocellatus TaxID=259542 RepID=A0AAV4BVF4_9GAST|nr:Pol polyprotein [Plakobranchus ocellatus]